MNKHKICILCGDDVEQQEHKVCSWHAICEKDNKGEPKYYNECVYALNKYKLMDGYMDYVANKKKEIFEILNSCHIKD